MQLVEWTGLLPPETDDAIGAVVLDEAFRIRACTPSVLEIAGYDEHDLLQLTALDVVHHDDLGRAADVINEVQAIPGRRAEGLYRLLFADGSAHPLCLIASNLGPEHANAIVYEFHRPSARLRAEAFSEDVVAVTALLAEQRPLDECIDAVARLAERHIDGCRLVVTVLDSAKPNTVASRHDIDDSWRQRNENCSSVELPTNVEAALDVHRAGPWRVSNRAGCVDDLVPGRVTTVLTDDDDIIGFVEVIRTSAEPPEQSEWLVHALVRRILTTVVLRHRIDEQLRQAADHDSLTGLVNRRRLLETMEAAHNPAGSAVIMVDLDRFSWINNTLGHLVGDAALVHAAHALTTASPPDATVARIGGDEFLIWIPSDAAAGLASLVDVGESIRTALATPEHEASVGPTDRRTHVRASVGVITMAAGESPGQAISRADDAMYRAKRAGGDRVEGRD